MASMLDIIHSVIVAGVIMLLVLGIHLMTMKTSTENRVIQEMQGMAETTISILQEEIRFLHSFASDSVRVSSNTLTFRDINDQIVFIQSFNDSLNVTKNSMGSLIGSGYVTFVLSSDTVLLSGSHTIPKGSLIRFTSPLTGEAQLKFVDYHINSLKILKVRGRWDMRVVYGTRYDVYNSTIEDNKTYKLSLLDNSPTIYTFSLKQLNPDGSTAFSPFFNIDSSNVDLINVNIIIKSDPNKLYSDETKEFTVNLNKDIFLRGYRLPSTGG